MHNRAAAQAIDRGLAYLTRQQRADGGFVSYSSPAIEPFQPSIERLTTFVPALMLEALAVVETPPARQLRGRLARFLIAQRSPAGSYNYWAKNAPERKTDPYPDDLDDTFCALAGLYLHDSSLIDDKQLAQSVKLLVAAETAAGGPYRTWLVPPAAPKVWLDVDLAVNANIAYFLSLVSNPLPNLELLLDQSVASGQLRSPYYPSAYPLLYYVSRTGNGQRRSPLMRLIRAALKSAVTAQDQALCLTALLRLGDEHNLKPALASLVSQQASDGSWPIAAFCIDPAQNGQSFYDGAAALTTALAIETLYLYLSGIEHTAIPTLSDKPATAIVRHKPFQSAVLKLTNDRCQNLTGDLRTAIGQALERVASSDNGPEIIALPHYFSASLRAPQPTAGNGPFLRTLGAANLFGWLAYTIYDDFLDEEGEPRQLSIANAAMRRSLDLFLEAAADDDAFQTVVRETFDTVDGANAWEIAHCRFDLEDQQLTIKPVLPDYGDLSQLAERSLGHTLTPLAILVRSSYAVNSPVYRQIRQALMHYLIARQLNDDAHDWQTDVQNGHISYVVRTILAEMGGKAGRQPLPELLNAMRQQFWYHTLPVICREMQRQISYGRRAADRSGVLQPANVITRLLDGIERSVEATLATQSGARSFLKQYKQRSNIL